MKVFNIVKINPARSSELTKQDNGENNLFEID